MNTRSTAGCHAFGRNRPVPGLQLRAAIVCAGLALSALAPAATRAAEKRSTPNIVFILADDLGYGDLGCYGQTKIKTPCLDRMAAEGLRFTQAYCGTSVCAPSRCALMTGLHIGHAPIRANREYQPEGQEPLPAGTFTVAKLFQSAGYQTAAFGKWGLGFLDTSGAPDKMGFDLFCGYNCQRQAHNYYPDHLWRNHERIALDGKTYSHDLLMEQARAWLREHGKSPFFLYLPVTIPHPQFQVPELGPYATEPWPEPMKKYAAMVTRLDADIGRLLALLKELGIDEQTLVIFTSDNGADNKAALDLFHSNGPLRGTKRTMYEGGIREPAIARWPGKIRPGTVSDTPWAFYDFLPTVSELIGKPLPAGVKTDGMSIAAVLLGKPAPSRELLYWELHEPRFMQAVRAGDWKLVRPGPAAPLELYDLAKDVGEAHDVAAEHPEVVKRLEGLLNGQHVESPIWPDKKPPAAKADRNRPAKAAKADGRRPNILWLIAEDMGPEALSGSGTPQVWTPNLDRLAKDGVRYANFYVGNVCSPSRSSFMTGMYATTIGAQNHRSHRDDGYQLPAGVRVLPDWMRDAGYSTANVVRLPPGCDFRGTGKTDWNFTVTGKPFDTSQWSDLASHQPFYAQINFSETHRAFHAPQRADPAKVVLPPYYPDHPVARADWAAYLDAASELDRKIGQVLKQLDDDGLAASTIVVFFGDNGQAQVRGKQFCYEEGLHVPLIIRWPKDFPPPAHFRPGTVDERFLEGIDLAPTMLAIAGAAKPAKMQGRIFLGDRCEPARQFTFGARDRCDETVMRIRTVRDAQYRYIRNFTPQTPLLAPNAYKERQYPVWNLLKELHAAGKLTPAQDQLCQPTLPPEELYDLKADPDEIHNLAGSNDPAVRAELERLRAVLERWIVETDDQGRVFEPPAVAAAQGATKPKPPKGKGK